MNIKTRKFQILAAILVLMLAALACGGSVSTANISSAKMFADSEGTQETTVYAQDQPFYCIVELANAPEDTKLKAVWTAVEVEGEQPDLVIDEAEVTAGTDSVFTFDLTNNQLWPIGKYKVDLYLNDELDRTLEFEVQ
jgi:ABC-type glycerol-3-phosphate transport system substrate-binding protein